MEPGTLLAAANAVLTENGTRADIRLNLEAKLGLVVTKGGKTSAKTYKVNVVQRPVWMRVRRQLGTLYGPETVEPLSTELYNGRYGSEGGSYRRRTDQPWEFKVYPRVLSDHASGYVLFSVGRTYSSVTPPTELGRLKKTLRTGTRYSWQVSPTCQLELTSVNQETRDYYEIEAVYLGQDLADLPAFLETVDGLVRLLQGTVVMYKAAEVVHLRKHLGDRLSSMLGSEESLSPNPENLSPSPERDLRRRDLGRLVPQSPADPLWAMSRRSNGERRLLVVCPLGQWLIQPPLVYNKLSSVATSSTAVFEVEEVLVEAAGETQRVLYLQDVLFVKSPLIPASLGEDVRSLPLLGPQGRLQRGYDYLEQLYRPAMEALPSSQRPPFTVSARAYKAFADPEIFFGLVEEMRQEGLQYATLAERGLESPLRHPWTGFTLTCNVGYPTAEQPRLRWRPLESLTLALRVHHDGRGGYELASADAQGLESLFPESHRLNPEVRPELLQEGAVVEFELRQGRLEALRPAEAPDRAQPIWRLMQNPLTEDDLTGHSLRFWTGYQNDLRRQLLQRRQSRVSRKEQAVLVGVNLVIDSELTDYDRVLLLESQPSRLLELAAAYQQLESPPALTALSGEVTEAALVTPWVDTLSQGRGAEAVALLDMAWDENTLPALAQTLKSIVREGGSVIWKGFDGSSVLDLFQPPYGGPDLEEVSFCDGRLTLRLLDQRRLQITQEGQSQVQPLLRLDELRRLLEPDFELSYQHRCDDTDRFLSSELLRLGSVYSYGVFVRKSGAFQKMAAYADSSRVVDLSQLKVGQVGSLAAGSGSLGSLTQEELAQYLNVSRVEAIPKTPGSMLQQLERTDGVTMEALAADWYAGPGTLTRVFTEPDGHCMLHAFLYATHPGYQAGKYEFRTRVNYNGGLYQPGERLQGKQARLFLARALREELSRYLTQEHLDCWNFVGASNPTPPLGAMPADTWELLNGSSLAASHFNQLKMLAAALREGADIGPGGRGIYDLDYSLSGLQKLLNSSELLGEEGLVLLSNYLPVNVGVLVGRYGESAQSRGDLTQYYRHPGPGSYPCCLMVQVTSPTDPGQTGQHYELVGVRNADGYLQTLFEPGHPLWQALEAFSAPEPVRPDFYQGLMDNVLADLTQDQPVDELVWLLLDEFCTRRAGSTLAIFPAYNRLYHHLWIRSANIMAGKFLPCDRQWTPKGLMPLHAHLEMTAQAIREAGGLETPRGQAILDGNCAYAALWMSGTVGVVNGQSYPGLLKDNAMGYVKKLLGAS